MLYVVSAIYIVGILLFRQTGHQAGVLLHIADDKQEVDSKGFTLLDRLLSATERLDSRPERRSSLRSSSCTAAGRAGRTPAVVCSSRCQRRMCENRYKYGLIYLHLNGVYASISPSFVNSLRR